MTGIYEMSIYVKCLEQQTYKDRFVVTRGCKTGEKGVRLQMGMTFLFKVIKCPKFDFDDGCTTLRACQIPETCTL